MFKLCIIEKVFKKIYMSKYNQVKKEELNVLSFIFPKYSQYLFFNDFLNYSEVRNVFNEIVKFKVLNTDTQISEIDFLNNNVCVTRFTDEVGKSLSPEKVIQTVLPKNELPLNLLSIYSWLAWQFRIDISGVKRSCIHHNQNKIFLLPDNFKGLVNKNNRLLIDHEKGLICFSSSDISYLEKEDKDVLKKLIRLNEYFNKINKIFIKFCNEKKSNIFSDKDDGHKPYYLYHNVDDFKKYKNKNEFFLDPFNKEVLLIENYDKVAKKIIDDFIASKYSLVEVKDYLDNLNREVAENHDIFKNKNYSYVTFAEQYDRLSKVKRKPYSNKYYNNYEYLKEDEEYISYSFNESMDEEKIKDLDNYEKESCFYDSLSIDDSDYYSEYLVNSHLSESLSDIEREPMNKSRKKGLKK